MFNEQKTNTLVLSSRLADRYPVIYNQLVSACEENSIATLSLNESLNIWCRDWMPIQVNGEFVKFRYGYGRDNPKFKNLAIKSADWRWLNPLKCSNLRLDGGNVVRHGDDIIMTDIIYRHNPDVPKTKLVARFEKLLQGNITVIPAEPGDDIGHADGICHFTPNGRLLVGHYAITGKRHHIAYFKRMVKSLDKFYTRLFPYAHHKCPRWSEKKFRSEFPNADTFNPGFGYYINFLTVGKLLFLPIFRIVEDWNAIVLARNYFNGYKVITIYCGKLAMEGGLINCVTVNYEF